MEIKKARVQVPLTSTSTSSIVVPHVDEAHNDQEDQINDPEVNNEFVVEQPQEIVLRISQREKKYVISDDYVVYLQELENDLSIVNDPVSFSEAINGNNSDKWLDVMKNEIKSMAQNCVWNLVKLLERCKRVGCKWVFKNVTLMAISNITRLDWLPKVLLKRMTLIIRKHFRMFLIKILSESSWH